LGLCVGRTHGTIFLANAKLTHGSLGAAGECLLIV
jgi:hypothetical protein